MMEMNFQEFESRFPTVFTDWHIVRKLGAGSYCSVYEVCKQTGSITERKALKHISFPRDPYELQAICSELGTSDPAVVREYIHQSVAQFEQEYQIMSDLGGQTNTVTCQDIRKIAKQDMPGYDIFFFMELLKSVSEASREQAFEEEDVIRLGIDICKALELLEKRNLIHRDIKPDNLFVNSNGDYKLGDFGAARLVSGVQSIVTTRGTPAYMPPEIAQMRPAGPWSDLYSLGLVMYRLLNNNLPPFAEDASSSGTTSLEASGGRRLSGEKLPKPVNGSSGLVAVVMKACEFDPAKRYQKAAQMREALEALRAQAEKTRGSKKTAVRKKEETAVSDSADKTAHTEDGNIRRINMTQAERDRLEEERRLRMEQEKREKEKQEDLKRKAGRQKLRKILIGIAAAAAVVALAFGAVRLISNSQAKKAEYAAAVALLEDKKYDEAQAAFAAFEDGYQDAAAKKREIREKLKAREDALEEVKASAGEDYRGAYEKITEMKKAFPETRQVELDGLIEDYKAKYEEQLASDKKLAGHEQTLSEARDLLLNKSADRENFDQAVSLLDGLEKEGYSTKTVEETRALAVTLQGALAALEEEDYDEVDRLLKDVSGSAAGELTAAAQAGRANEKRFDEGLGYMAEAREKLSRKSNDYGNAKDRYALAQDKFKELGSYAKKGDPAAARKTECGHWIDYLDGRAAMDEENYEDALPIFESLANEPDGGFEDSADLARAVRQLWKKRDAEDAYLTDLDQAEQLYTELGTLGDQEGSEAGLEKVRRKQAYLAALSKLQQGIRDNSRELLEDAKADFTSLTGFEDAADKVTDCGNALLFLTGLEQLEGKQYKDAKSTFAALKDYPGAAEKKDLAETLIQAEKTYNEAVSLMDMGQYASAQDKFNAVLDYYEDAAGLAESCRQHDLYNKALDSITLGRLPEARATLNALNELGFAEAAEQIGRIDRYESSVVLKANGEYEPARDNFRLLGQFYDAEKLAEECDNELTYTNAVSIMNENPEKARDLFSTIISLHDSYSLLQECETMIKYNSAVAAKNEGNIKGAYDIFSSLDYGDSGDQAAAMYAILQYQEAERLANEENNFEEAIKILNTLDSEESRALLIRCRYGLAVHKENSGEYASALDLFNQVPDYSDSAAHAKECECQLFCIKMRDSGFSTNEFQTWCFRYIYYSGAYRDKEAWGNCIIRQPQTAVDTALSFATSVDLLGISISNSDRVDALYHIMLGKDRDVDSNAFVTALDYGMSMFFVIRQISLSDEFGFICERLGIERGEVTVTEFRDQEFSVTGYISRCYREFLDRQTAPSAEELNGWCETYFNGSMTIAEIIRWFVNNSPEFSEKSVSNADFVTKTFRTVLDRDPDEGAMNDAMEYFKLGNSQSGYLEALLTSHEFNQNLMEANLH